MNTIVLHYLYILGGIMKKSKLVVASMLGALAAATILMSGCNGGGGEEPQSQGYIDLNVRPDGEKAGNTETGEGGEGGGTTENPADGDVVTAEEEASEFPKGLTEADCYRSELTNLWTDKKLQNQRPVAIMVDNERTAYDHYGLNSADIIYELMNSTANDRVTRLMCIVKDWENLQQFGSIRSTRPTNVILAGEYNAILVHDGGPFYINKYLARSYSNNLSGGFARFKNGKAYEFTEYVTSKDTNGSDGLVDRIAQAGYSTTYNSYYPGLHFNFNSSITDLSSNHSGSVTGKDIYLPHPHNKSELHYNEQTHKYEYKCYGMAHIDPLDNNKVLSFENVILQCTGWSLCRYDDGTPDPNGYMIYDVVNSDTGYYFTEGRCINIRWKKTSETDLTHYYDAETGEELRLNTGKTYISLIPNDNWSKLQFN